MELRIKEICEIKGIRIGTLAEKAEMRPESLSRLMNNGNSNPTIETLQKIAEALEVPIQDLFKSQPSHHGNDLTCPNCGSHLEIKIKAN